MSKFALGIDYGTNSARCIVIDLASGKELSAAVYPFTGGNAGVLGDPEDHNIARQKPAEYLAALRAIMSESIEQAQKTHPDFNAADIISIGVDTTGSTPIPVAQDCTAVGMLPGFEDNLDAQAWLWKDHSSHAEAAQITELAAEIRPEYLDFCGGTYSSEWFFSKIFHCLNVAPEVFEKAFTWMECCDYIPAVLAGIKDASQVKRSTCAGGHKAMWSANWSGLPDKEFLSRLNPKLADLRDRLYEQTYSLDTIAGELCPEWAEATGVPAGTPIAVGMIDAHMGAVGAGAAPGALVKIIGTSCCDIMIADKSRDFGKIPGLCGIAADSVVPGFWGMEAGQAAIGDLFKWYVDLLGQGHSHEALTVEAQKQSPGQSGLIALDWNNGNRSVLMDQQLTGLILGQTLHTTAAEIYRALIEATAFGARKIIDMFDNHGVEITTLIACGGISHKNPMLMQIYADITKRKIQVSASEQSCALGAAIAGTVAVGANAGGFSSVADAQKTLCPPASKCYEPIAENSAVYDKLYSLFSRIHDSFGAGATDSLSDVMKTLLQIKQDAVADNRG